MAETKDTGARFDQQVFDQGIAAGLSHRVVSSLDNGTYLCRGCGHVWKARERFVWWPIRVRWAAHVLRAIWPFRRWSALFDVWGWQIGWDGIEQRVFGRSVRLGPIVITFGRQREELPP